jgi:hypothetical protein
MKKDFFDLLLMIDKARKELKKWISLQKVLMKYRLFIKE